MPFHHRMKELRKVLPNVIGDQLLRNFWSYKYLGGGDDDDAEENHSGDIQSGVPPHADLASVNLNLCDAVSSLIKCEQLWVARNAIASVPSLKLLTELR